MSRIPASGPRQTARPSSSRELWRGAPFGDAYYDYPLLRSAAASLNLKAPKAVGLEIPPMLLARADEVVEQMDRRCGLPPFQREPRIAALH